MSSNRPQIPHLPKLTQSTNSKQTITSGLQLQKSDKTIATNSSDGSVNNEARSWTSFRERKQPAPDPNEPPLEQIKFYLDRYKIKEALQVFFDENTLNLFRLESDFMWELIPIICKRLRGLNQYRFRVFEGCERMLCRIAVDENCNPKEVLISLLAEMSHVDEQPGDDNIFRAMIRPLEGTLLRMDQPTPRDENLRWVLDVLLRHVNSIDFPQEYNLEGKKRLSLPNEPSVKRFIETLPLLLSFMEEFNVKPLDQFDKSPMPILTESQIEEVFNGELVDDDDLISDQNTCQNDSMDATVSALLSLMSKPLAFLDLTSYCADLRLFGNRCLNTLLRLKPNLFAPIYKRISQKYNSIENSDNYSFNGFGGGLYNETNITLANCSYIYRCERAVSFETAQCFPQVIKHESLLTCHIPFIVALLERSEILVHEKGLTLLESLFKHLEIDSLNQSYLDLFESSMLHKQLFRIMVYSPLCTNRKRAYDLFTTLCDLLTHDCKLKLFKYILNDSELRPCVRAACIDQYRKHLTTVYRELMNLQQQLTTLAQDVSDSKIVQKMRYSHFRYKALGGNALIEFLDLCIKACLPDSQHTDIIENYELLLATLTMFRFLKLRHTIFKDEIEDEYLSGKKLKKIFFDPIRSAIALIMNELKLHHKDIVEGHKSRNSKITQNSILNVSQSRNEFDLLSRILGQNAKGLEEAISIEEPKDKPTQVPFDEQDETDCLNWALCRLDLVESVLVRTCDLYNC